MSVVDGFTRACLASAARRWPADLSEPMSREWRAELDAVRADRTLGPVARSWRAVAFAASLAVSPAVEAADAPPRTWRDHAVGVGRAATWLSGLAGVTLLAAAGFNVVHEAYHGFGRHLSPMARVMAELGLVVAAVGVMSRIGLMAAQRRRAAPAGRSAVLCVAALGLSMSAFLVAGNRVAVMPFMGWIDIAPGVAAWVVLMSVAVRLATRYAGSGRRRLGLLAAVGGGLVAVDSAAIGGSLHAAAALGVGYGSAPAWFPLALLPGGTADVGPASTILLGNVSAIVGPLLLCSAFAVAYALGGAGVEVPGPDPVVAGSRTIRLAAAGMAVTGVAAWTYLAVLAPGPAASSRLVAIVLVGCALVVALSGRGPVAVPATGALAVLMAADLVASRGQRHGLAQAVALLAIGTASIYAAWRLSGERPGTAASSRPVLLATAVLAALTVPTSTGLTSPATAVTYLLAALSWLVAVTAALAARPYPFGLAMTATVIALPLAALLVTIGMTAHTAAVYAPLAVLALAVARWDGSAGTVRQLASWLSLGAGAAVLTVSVSTALRQPDGVVGTTLMRIQDNSNVFGFGFTGHLAGRTVLAVMVGVLAARCAEVALARR